MRDKVLEIHARLAEPHVGIEIKGKKTAYTAVNGNMFSFVDPEGRLCIRLSEPRKAAFNARHGTGDVIQYNAVMRGYVGVPVAMLGDEKALAALFAEAVEHARGLKPKPTRKQK